MDDFMDISFHVDDGLLLKPTSGRDKTIYDWPVDELKILCERVKDATLKLSKVTSTPYNKAEARLQWDTIAFNGHSGDACLTKWHQICSNVRTFRTLSEIVTDAEQWLKKPTKVKEAKIQGKTHPDKPTRPPTVFFRYLMDQIPKVKQQNPTLAHKQIVSLISEKYKTLSEKKMRKLREEFDRLNQEYKVKLEEFYQSHPEIAPSKSLPAAQSRGNSGFSCFVAEKTGDPQYAKMSKEELRVMWNQMKDKKKIYYIESALANHQLNQPGTNLLMSKPTKDILTRDEREFYDKFLGKPEKPPTSGFNLFKSMASHELKDLNMIERNKQLAERWNMLSRADQNKFNNEVKILKYSFDTKMAEYNTKLAQREKAISDTKCLGTNFIELNGTSSPPKRVRIEEASSKKDTIVAVPPKKKKKPLTAKQWYQESNLDDWKAQNSHLSERDIINAIGDHFDGLSEKKKNKWARKAEEEDSRRKSE